MINIVYKKGIEIEKRNLVINYMRSMMAALILYIILFKLFIPDRFIVKYALAGFVLTSSILLIIKKNNNISVLVRLYMFIAPLYSLFLLIIFWKYTIVNITWFLPIPLAAHIFLTKKDVYLYSIYIIILISIAIAINGVVQFNMRNYSRNEIVTSDLLVYTVNLWVIVLLLYYREKIKKIEMFNILELLNSNQIPTVKNYKEISLDDQLLEGLFIKIDEEIKVKELFKDSDFSLSKLSAVVGVNPSYISKAIHYNNYNNFNHYINTLRIEYIKNKMSNVDLKKVTLLYIYSDAGFSNQSTFNRCFKQIQGVTPREYINSINKISESN